MSKKQKNSIKAGKVPLKEDILDKSIAFLSSFYFIFICLLAIIWGLGMILSLSVEGEFTGFLIYVLAPLLIIFGIYGIYRVWKNRELLKIETSFSEMENKALLIDFLQQRKYHIISQTNNSIFVIEEESMSVNDLWTKHFTFIINDHAILFNVQKNYPRLNPPVFFTHILLKNDLKKFIAQKTKIK